MANYITNEEFLSLWVTLKDKDATIDSLMNQCKAYSEQCAKYNSILKASQAIIEYQTQGAKESFIEWDVLFGNLESAVKAIS